MPTATATKLRTLLENLLQAPLPVRLKAWDGSVSPHTDAGTLVIRNRRALRHLLWEPNELGLARAYVAGDLEVEGDLYDTLDRLAELIWRAPDIHDLPMRAVAGDLIRLGALGSRPKPPPEEIALAGVRHSRRRDRRAISHHYDVGNDFYRIVLGASMVYSCAYWTDEQASRTDEKASWIDERASGADERASGAGDGPAYALADAQRDKLDLICRKLDLRPGMRLLDVGCGWGGLARRAAGTYGVDVVGITLSTEQADFAHKQVAEDGLSAHVDIRVQDYRDLDDGPFDAIASVGMAEHVGTAPYAEYASILYGRLRPGGRLLNHQIAAIRPAPRPKHRTFIDAYVFPDSELAPLGTTVSLLEEAGFEVRDVQALREHYARTLRSWVSNLERGWSEAVRLTSVGRARVWRLYMAASALAFEQARIGVNQILAVRPSRAGVSGMPPVRAI